MQNNDMPKVSVIIPVYGVEKYIERCARSLFEQTLDDIEYIFVDDSTPDNSISILRKVLSEYPNREKQVKILRHEKNKGLAQARQTGLKIASGEYIAHCDSDDWVDVHMYEEMYNKAIEEDADVVVCDFCSTDCENEQYSKGLISKERENVIVDVLLWRIAGCLWNKLVRRKEYTDHDLNYPTHNMGEDTALIVQILWNAKRISYLPKPLYYYYTNPTSITKDVTDEKIRKRFLQATANVEIIEQFLVDKATGKIKDALTKYIFEQSYLLVSLARKNKEDLSIWRRSVGKIRSRVYKCSYLSIKNKLVFYFLLFKSVI